MHVKHDNRHSQPARMAKDKQRKVKEVGVTYGRSKYLLRDLHTIRVDFQSKGVNMLFELDITQDFNVAKIWYTVYSKDRTDWSNKNWFHFGQIFPSSVQFLTSTHRWCFSINPREKRNSFKCHLGHKLYLLVCSIAVFLCLLSDVKKKKWSAGNFSAAQKAHCFSGKAFWFMTYKTICEHVSMVTQAFN